MSLRMFGLCTLATIFSLTCSAEIFSGERVIVWRDFSFDEAVFENDTGIETAEVSIVAPESTRDGQKEAVYTANLKKFNVVGTIKDVNGHSIKPGDRIKVSTYHDTFEAKVQYLYKIASSKEDLKAGIYGDLVRCIAPLPVLAFLNMRPLILVNNNSLQSEEKVRIEKIFE